MKLSAEKNELIEEACRQSEALLVANSTRHGILASRENPERNYHAVWGRDGSICACGAFVSDNEAVRAAGVTTLRTLAAHQAENGQMPSYLHVDEQGEITDVVYGGLGNVTNIDSNLWYLIAAHAAYFQGGYTEFLEEDQFGIYRRTLRHLESLDSDSCGFLEIPVGGDWTDILDWSYHVLYDQVLWYQALRCAAALFREREQDGLREKLLRRAGRVRDRLNEEFWWDRRAVPEAVRRYYIHDPVPEETDFHYYQSHLKPFFNTWHHRFDAFGNTLAALAGIAPPERADRIIELIHVRSLNDPYPLRVLDPPIQPSDADWNRIYEVWEPPFEYHNGGIWPMAGGFWAMLLRERGRLPEAEEALLQLARSLKVPGADGREWAFHEYFHGRTGAPMGHRFQSWNAGSFLLAYQAIRKGKDTRVWL